MNENLARWLFQSIAKHFVDTADGLSLPYFVEGIDERSEDDMRVSHVELRITGPEVKEVSKGYYQIEVTVNFLFTKQMVMSGADAFDLIQWTGIFANKMLQPIPIYKKGTGADDDGSLIGCLQIDKGRNEKARIFHFGQIKPDTRVRMSGVDAVYSMDLSN